MKNPFVVSGYAGEETFCDRVAETARLISLLENGSNIALTALRRVGKTNLIQHVFAQDAIRENYITINVDIYATQNLSEFVMALGRAIIDALRPRSKKYIDRFIQALRSIRSEFTFDINGIPVWGIGIGQSVDPQITIEEIFEYINNSEKPCLIAVDEFQQIIKYPEPFKVEAMLRTHIQRASKARFIFAGSQQHMMAEIFATAAHPFYMSAALVGLPLIGKDIYADFCVEMFEKNGRALDRNAALSVYDMFHGITAYMQRVMNEMFAASDTPAPPTGTEAIRTAVDTIIKEASDNYEILFNQLTRKQRELMIALALQDGENAPMGGEFVRKYRLLSPSSVRSSLQILMERDLVTKDHGKYFVYDRFFQLWLGRKYGCV